MLPFTANAVTTFKWLPTATHDEFEPVPSDLSWGKLDMQQFCCGLSIFITNENFNKWAEVNITNYILPKYLCSNPVNCQKSDFIIYCLVKTVFTFPHIYKHLQMSC